jgi:probable rRNA maturation factor
MISVETAERQAAEEGHGSEWELEWLVAHGVLHLLDYDDDTEEHRARMLQRQTEIVGSPRPRAESGATATGEPH